MSRTTSARDRPRGALTSTVVGLILLAVAAIIAARVHRAATSPAAVPPSHAPVPSSLAPVAPPPAPPRVPGDGHRRGRGDVLGATEADGVLPDGMTVFDDSYPGVANLQPDLLRTLRAAATDAATDGVGFVINSGWRSPDYQDELLRQAVEQYGSEAEAARWVATAETSPHVLGKAADLGGSAARAWLSRHGANYGLCQIYRNEPWHFELRPEAIDGGCPHMYADPTDDPRMYQ